MRDRGKTESSPASRIPIMPFRISNFLSTRGQVSHRLHPICQMPGPDEKSTLKIIESRFDTAPVIRPYSLDSRLKF